MWMIPNAAFFAGVIFFLVYALGHETHPRLTPCVWIGWACEGVAAISAVVLIALHKL